MHKSTFLRIWNKHSGDATFNKMSYCKFFWGNSCKAIQTFSYLGSFSWDSRTLPVGFPLPTISKNSLYTLFYTLILDHGVSLMISISGAKILISYIILDTFFTIVFNLWSWGPIFFWISRLYNSNSVLSFSYSRIINLYNPSKMSSCGIFVMNNRIPSHLESNSWTSSFRWLIVNRLA